jgi:hypothetical protein
MPGSRRPDRAPGVFPLLRHMTRSPEARRRGCRDPGAHRPLRRRAGSRISTRFDRPVRDSPAPWRHRRARPVGLRLRTSLSWRPLRRCKSGAPATSSEAERRPSARRVASTAPRIVRAGRRNPRLPTAAGPPWWPSREGYRQSKPCWHPEEASRRWPTPPRSCRRHARRVWRRRWPKASRRRAAVQAGRSRARIRISRSAARRAASP